MIGTGTGKPSVSLLVTESASGSHSGGQAEKRLRILDAATSLGDLAVLNSNRLEPLKGDRKGQQSIRINDQWRICFEWPKDSPDPLNVEIVDYH